MNVNIRKISFLKAVVAVAIALALVMPGGLALIKNEKITDEIISSSGSDNPSLGALQTDRYFFHPDDMSGERSDKKTIRLMLENTVTLSGYGFTIMWNDTVLTPDFRYDINADSYFVNGTWEGTAADPPLIIRIDPQTDHPSTLAFGGAALTMFCPPGADPGEHVAYYFNITVKEDAPYGCHDVFWFIPNTDFTTCQGATFTPTLQNGTFCVEGLPPNDPPVISNPSPPDGATNVPVDLSEVSVLIEDPNGDTFNWVIEPPGSVGCIGMGTTNGTKTCLITGDLEFDTEYTWRVNATDQWGLSTEEIFTFTTRPNSPPVFSIEQPPDGATDVPITISEVSVYIADPEGDRFDFILSPPGFAACIGFNSTNDTKNCTITETLEYGETYVWSIYAEDEYGLFRDEDYSFTIEQNYPPEFSNEQPPDGATDVPITLSEVSIYIADPEGDYFSWSINPPGGGLGCLGIIGSTNGTKSCSVMGPLEYGTTYDWTVSATDEHGTSANDTYTFTTEVNDAPVFSNEEPEDESTDVPITTSELCVDITDPEGHTFNWTITTSPDVGSGGGTEESDGTKCISVSGLENDTTYSWTVTATDEHGETTEETYTFTTPAGGEPDISIGEITGGIGVDAIIKNIGTAPADDVDWSINVKGGILNLIDKTTTGTDDIGAGEEVTVSTEELIFGLGPIEITATADGEEKKVNGFIIFIYIVLT